MRKAAEILYDDDVNDKELIVFTSKIKLGLTKVLSIDI